MPNDLPSTSKDIPGDLLHSPELEEADTRDELQMVDINLQSENEIALDDNRNDSVVVTYLRNNKDIVLGTEGPNLCTNKKKSSLLESVAKMETIVEGRRFVSFGTQSELSPDAVPIEEEDQETSD